MNQQKNVSVVEAAYDAFKRGDIPALLNLLSDDVDWAVPGPAEIPFAGERQGRNQVREFFRIVAESSDFDTFEPVDHIAQADQVVTLGHYAGRAKNTGRRFESNFAMKFRLRDGKIAGFQEYMDTANLAAAYAGAGVATAGAR